MSMAIVFVGIDLAKIMFARQGVDEYRKALLVLSAVRGDQLMDMVAKLPPCTFGMEVWLSAHHRAREFEKFGRRCRLMAPKFVVMYRMSGERGKTDAADAAAICEAMQRPTMPFVPVKSGVEQSRLSVHAVLQGWVEARRACINRRRGLFSEFGVPPALKRQTGMREAAAQLK
jgi:transposase